MKHNINSIKQCLLCSREFNRLSSHIERTHSVSYEQYLIDNVYGGKRPLCACACEQETPFTKSQGQGFKQYIHGHHLRGKRRSDETKRKIGKTNSINMIQYFVDHPGMRSVKSEQLRSGVTPESEAKRAVSLKAAWKDDDGRKMQLSQQSKERWSSGKMDDMGAKSSLTQKSNLASGKTVRTEEWRNKISETITKKYLSGGFQWSRGEYVSTKDGKIRHYRSSWERRHMELLDLDENVLSYDYEPFCIDYVWQGKGHRYLPDFVVRYSDGRIEMHEVGVKTLKQLERARAKQAAAEEYCARHGWKFRIISEDDLFPFEDFSARHLARSICEVKNDELQAVS